MESGRRTFVLVDGENIDATLGNSLLKRRPNPEERPRWERVTEYAANLWGQPVTGLFFLNATGGNLPTSFVQALLAMGYRPIPLAGRDDEKVVDLGIMKTLDALLGHPEADLVLVSHDVDFVDHVRRLQVGERRTALFGFREYTASAYDSIDVPVHDLEDDVGAFKVALPRVRIIDLDDFDPERYLR
jgi:uncharacterized protein